MEARLVGSLRDRHTGTQRSARRPRRGGSAATGLLSLIGGPSQLQRAPGMSVAADPDSTELTEIRVGRRANMSFKRARWTEATAHRLR